MRSERLCHGLCRRLQLNECVASIAVFWNSAGGMTRVEDLTPHVTRGDGCGGVSGNRSLRSSAPMGDTVFVIGPPSSCSFERLETTRSGSVSVMDCTSIVRTRVPKIDNESDIPCPRGIGT